MVQLLHCIQLYVKFIFFHQVTFITRIWVLKLTRRIAGTHHRSGWNMADILRIIQECPVIMFTNNAGSSQLAFTSFLQLSGAQMSLLSAGRHSRASRNFCGMKGLLSTCNERDTTSVRRSHNYALWLTWSWWIGVSLSLLGPPCCWVLVVLPSWRRNYIDEWNESIKDDCLSAATCSVATQRGSKLCRDPFAINLPRPQTSSRTFLAAAGHPMKYVGCSGGGAVLINFRYVISSDSPWSQHTQFNIAELFDELGSHRMGWPRKGSSWNRYRNSI